MPKSGFLLEEDFVQFEAKILEKIDEFKKEVLPQIPAVEDRCNKQIQALSQQVQRIPGEIEEASTQACTDAKSHADSRVDTLSNELHPLISNLDEDLRQTRKDLEQLIEETDSQTRQTMIDRFTECYAHIDREIGTLRKEAKNAVAQTSSGAEEALQKTRDELDAAMDEVKEDLQAARTEAEERDVDNRVETASLIKMVRDEHAAAVAVQKKEARDMAHDYNNKIDNVQDALNSEETRAISEEQRVSFEASKRSDEVQQDANDKFDVVDQTFKEVKAFLHMLDTTTTRRIDWNIRNASKQFRGGTGSWISPVFDAGGCTGLSMELRVLGPNDPPAENAKQGDCAIFIRGSPGTTVSCRLFVGTKAHTMELRFTPYNPVVHTPRLCFLAQQIDRKDDVMKIGMEILETVRNVKRTVGLPLSDVDKTEHDAAVDAKSETNMYKFAYSDEAADEKEIQTTGTILFQKFITHRLLEQVRLQVERMKSRMVRRVEWRLEQASSLKKSFPYGQSVTSKIFDCAGVEGLQMIFYPGGYLGAQEGQCSFFLKTPAGVTLTCFLMAGKERRQASRTADQPEGAFGSTNFARLERCFEEEGDVVILALEVEDAHQEVASMLTHYPAPGKTKQSDEAKMETWGQPVGSIVKMRREGGRVPGGMQDVKLLPSIWVTRNLHEVVARPNPPVAASPAVPKIRLPTVNATGEEPSPKGASSPKGGKDSPKGAVKRNPTKKDSLRLPTPNGNNSIVQSQSMEDLRHAPRSARRSDDPPSARQSDSARRSSMRMDSMQSMDSARRNRPNVRRNTSVGRSEGRTPSLSQSQPLLHSAKMRSTA